MKAKCIKPLRVDGYQFEEGKEYDFECHDFARERDDRDHVLARGHKVRHLRYAVNYNFFVPKPFKKGKDRIPATLYLYDRQYCEHENYEAPAIDPMGWTSGGPLLCFDDFFEELIDRRGGRVTFSAPTALKPLRPWMKEEMDKLTETVLGDKAKEPVIFPTDMPTRMNMEAWRHEMMNYPKRPREIHIPVDDLNVVAKWCNEIMKVMPPIDPDELKELGITIKAK